MQIRTIHRIVFVVIKEKMPFVQNKAINVYWSMTINNKKKKAARMTRITINLKGIQAILQEKKNKRGTAAQVD